MDRNILALVECFILQFYSLQDWDSSKEASARFYIGIMFVLTHLIRIIQDAKEETDKSEK